MGAQSRRYSLYCSLTKSASKRISNEITLPQQANVIRKANGVFLIVRYHLDALVQAAAMSIQHVREVLEGLPSNMTEVYEAAWGRILAQNPLNAEIGCCVLSWVSCAKRPMRKLQILHAASIYAGSSDQRFRSYLTYDCILQPDYIFSVCVGLISLDESNDSFGFFHATAASYFHGFFTSQLDGHKNILQCSVAYLSMDCFSKSDFQVYSPIDIINDHPLLDYIPLQFEYHYNRVMESNRQLAYDLLWSLFDTVNQFRSDCQAMLDEYENLTGGDSVPRKDEALRNMTNFGIHPLPEMICRDQGGCKWWSTRHHRLLAYKNNPMQERFMVDISAYFAPMPLNSRARNTERASVLDIQTDHIIIFPPTIKGYTLYDKRWVDLQVDEIVEVVWNKEAFKRLIMEHETKELIQAHIRLEFQKPNLISGQSNSRVFLLYGGPGTGKTHTAEIVAELAEKPLHRISCGDIGTKLEVVESYFESVLRLGKIWECVVLLDEADVFLEQRTPEDPARALTAVLVKLLESYGGLLILTSNRVGTFDEAFKSHIKLSLHYRDLTAEDRMKIWHNFFENLEKLGQNRIDLDDLKDHLEELTRNEMNGSEIRNVIWTALALADHRDGSFNFGCLNEVLEIWRNIGVDRSSSGA